ncbi:MAG TPA: PQQ-binding-like beta-propeller repeat protein [Anaerolineae bacterium]
MKTHLTRRWASIAVIVFAAGLITACGGAAAPTSWSGIVVSGQTAYLTSTDRIYAIDIEPTTNDLQRQKWTYPPANQSTAVTFHGQPFLAEDGTLYAGTDSFTGQGNFVVALDTNLIIDSGDATNPAKTVNTQWRYPGGENAPSLGSLFDGVASDGKSIFVATSDGHVLSLDAMPQSQFGQVNWVFTATQRTWSAPVISGTTVYFTSQDHNLYALDAATGRSRWAQPFKASGLLAGSPTVYGDTVYVGAFDQKLYAVDAATGQGKWEFPTQGWLWDGPAVFEDILYFGDLSGYLYAVKLDGTAAWDQPLKLEGMIRARPLVTDDRLYVPTGAPRLYALDRATRNILWTFPAVLPDGRQVPPLQSGESFLTTPVLIDDYLLLAPLPAGASPVRLYSINATSGNMEWLFPPRAQ